MRLLVTGANGYLGSSLLQDLASGHIALGTYGKNAQPGLLPLDVTDEKRAIDTIVRENPEMVIHCASISKGEFDKDNDYEKLVKVNVEGAKNVILGVHEIGASLIFISSPTVFEGRKGPFTEKDTPGTDDVYGQTRIAVEQIVSDSGLPHLIIRPSMIVGVAPMGMERKYFGKVIHAIQTGNPTELDDKWQFAPSWNHHIADVIDWWITHQDEVSLLHVVAPEVTTQLQFGREICSKLGVDPSVLQKKEPPWSGVSNILDGSKLKALGAPTVTHDEMITRIVSEIQRPTNQEGNTTLMGERK